MQKMTAAKISAATLLTGGALLLAAGPALAEQGSESPGGGTFAPLGDDAGAPGGGTFAPLDYADGER